MKWNWNDFGEMTQLVSREDEIFINTGNLFFSTIEERNPEESS